MKPKSKLRCGTCYYLSKSTVCAETGHNKGNPACKNWEPDLSKLSTHVQQIVSLMHLCTTEDVPVLRWILDKQNELLEDGSAFKIGEPIYLRYDGKDYQAIITNVTARGIIAKAVDEMLSFTLSPQSRIFKSLEELQHFYADIEALKEPAVKEPTINVKLGFPGNCIMGRVIKSEDE